MDGMAAKGLEAVRSGQTQILPERFEKVYSHRLEPYPSPYPYP